MTRRERWVAPAGDGGVLIDPPLDQAEELLATNQRRFKNAKIEILGRSLQEIRNELQESRNVLRFKPSLFKLITGAYWPWPKWPVGPILAAGHQPELFHPGVWIKNFALNGIARRHGWAPLNFVVDSDTVKTASIQFPVWNPDPPRVSREVIPFDAWHGEELHLRRPVHDAKLFREFPAAARHVWEQWPFEPLLPKFWQKATHVNDEVLLASSQEGSDDRPPTLMWCMTAARRAIESQWGCSHHEPFLLSIDRRHFIAHVLADLPRFHSLHNECVRAYRRKYRLRSRTHPVPELAADGDYLEAPFWWYDAPTGQRRRLFARTRDGLLELRPGREGAPVAIPFTELHGAAELAQRGVYLYTRALTTTMFMRLFVADLFIHGIGGAKYDEVTDDIIRRYFGIEPPEYLVVSGTLHLPFPRFQATAEDRKRKLQALRDHEWNPQRYVSPEDPKIRSLVDQKQDWTKRDARTSAERRERFRMLLRTTEALRSLVASRMETIAKDLTRCEQELAANEILFRRDYPFVLYPEEKLKPFCTQLLNL